MGYRKQGSRIPCLLSGKVGGLGIQDEKRVSGSAFMEANVCSTSFTCNCFDFHLVHVSLVRCARELTAVVHPFLASPALPGGGNVRFFEGGRAVHAQEPLRRA